MAIRSGRKLGGMMGRSARRSRSFSFYFFWIYFTWYALPVMRGIFRGGLWNGIFFSFFVVGCLLWSVSGYRDNKLVIERNYFAVIPVLIYFIVLAVLALFNIMGAARHIRVSFSFWGTLIAFWMMKSDERGRVAMTKFLFIVYIVTLITTGIGVYTDPYAARLLTNASNDVAEDIALMRKNIGGLNTVQSATLIIPVIIDALIHRKNKILPIISLVLLLLFLSSASFTISLAVGVIAIFLGFFMNIRAFQWKWLLLFVAISVVTILDWSMVLSWLAVKIGNESIGMKINALSLVFSSKGSQGFLPILSGRLEDYTISWNTFLQTIVGVGPDYSFTLDNGVGFHSQLLDDLARYGVFGALFYIAFFSLYYRLLNVQWSKIGRKQIAKQVVIIYLLLLLLNPGFTDSFESITVLFILPGLPSVIEQRKQRRPSAAGREIVQ